jgi:ketosteroid isomerase-like protein
MDTSRMSADLAPLAAWLDEFQARVRAVGFEGARALCVEEILAFGTVAEMVEGLDGVGERQWRRVWANIRDFTIAIDQLRGGISGDLAWVAAPWHSLGVRPDGSTFERAGRLTVMLVRRAGRWRAAHTHVSLSPER